MNCRLESCMLLPMPTRPPCRTQWLHQSTSWCGSVRQAKGLSLVRLGQWIWLLQNEVRPLATLLVHSFGASGLALYPLVSAHVCMQCSRVWGHQVSCDQPWVSRVCGGWWLQEDRAVDRGRWGGGGGFEGKDSISSGKDFVDVLHTSVL